MGVKRLRFTSLLEMFSFVLHHMGITEWLRLYFCLRPLSARAFGMTGKSVQGVCVSAEEKLFPALLTLSKEVVPEHVLLPACRPPAGELCGSPVEFASYH